jgi:hypothetical protein
LESPKFYSIKYSERDKINDKDYFSIDTDDKDEFEKAQKYSDWNVKINTPPKKYSKDRTKIKLDMDSMDVLEEYVSLKNPPDKDRILKVGKQLLTESIKD